MKLAVAARNLPAVARALEAAAPNRAGTKGDRAKLVSTYFDTADHALAQQGLTIRVREHDGSFIQTVKSQTRPEVAAAARGEWEDVVFGAAPDPNAALTGPFLGAEIAGRLAPLFRTEIDRRTIGLAPAPDTAIEAAIDRGRVCVPACDASEPISEIELELKRGSPAALYDVALDLLAVAPVRLERRSKAERGFALAQPAPPSAAHSTAVDLAPTLSGSEALRRLGVSCLDQILRNEAAVLAGIPEGIHQMRVAVRRLRAVLSAFGKMLPADQRRRASAELRWLADALGPARNLDVFRESVLAPARAAIGETSGIMALSAAAVRRRAAAYARAKKAVRSTRYTASLLQLFRWFEGSGWRSSRTSRELGAPVGALAVAVLDRRRRVARRCSKGFAKQSAAERHRLRIALKKERYVIEALAGLYPENEVRRFARRLKRLQDDLGEANDLRVARDIVAELAQAAGDARSEIVGAGDEILAWHKQRLAARERQLRQHLQGLLDAEPFWRP